MVNFAHFFELLQHIFLYYLYFSYFSRSSWGIYHSLFQVVHIVSWHLKIEQALLVKNLISFK